MATVLFPLPNDKFTWVDAEDLPRIEGHVWRVRHSGSTWYAYTYVGGRNTPMPNLITPPPPGMVVDHIDRNGLNNSKTNLRFATNLQNTWNRGKPRDSKSPYKGVSYSRKDKRWVAQIKDGTKTLVIGRFTTALEAARAYDAKARELRGEFAATNFPDWGKEAS